MRSLMAAVTGAGLLLAWEMAPTWYARQFVAAINSRDYARAEYLCADTTSPFPGDYKDYGGFYAQSWVSPFAWRDFATGHRSITVGVEFDFDECWVADDVEFTATHRGIVAVKSR
jgi:hypothetical protein